MPSVGAVFILLISTACASNAGVRAACPTAFERQATARIASLLNSYHDLRRFDGVALVARGDCVLFEGAWGEANREWHIANTVETRFRIGSVTKAFTAVALHRLALAGRLELDAPASRYLGDIDSVATRRYTVRQLMWHRSGLPDFNDDPAFFEYVQNADTPWDSVLAQTARAPLRFAPDSGFGYSNDAYWLLGAVLESATGLSWARALDSLVLRPFGLVETVADRPRQVLPRRATGYRDAFDGLSIALPYRATADAGLYSTARDLWRFLRALSDSTKMPSQLRRAIWADRPDGNAQGFTREELRSSDGTRRYRLFRQDGAVYGFFATTFTIPERQWHIVLLTNYRRPYNSLREIASQIVTVLDGGEPAQAAVTLGTRLDSLRRARGEDAAIGCIRSALCRGNAVVNETELNIWAWTLDEQGARKAAIESFDALTEIFPGATATWFGLASVAARAGDVTRASRAIDRLLKLDPTHQGALRLRERLRVK